MSTRAQLLAEVASQFADNTSGAITPAILRTVTSDFINSALSQSLTVVDAAYGTSGGARNDATRPYQTLIQAAAVAVSGDTVVVYPGTYTDKNVQFATGVVVFMFPGAFWSATAAAMTDSNMVIDATHQFSIDGFGHLRITNPLATNGETASPSVVRVNGGTTATVRCGQVEGYQTDGSKVGQHFIVCMDNGGGNSLTLNCQSIGGNLTIATNARNSVAITGCFGLYYMAAFNNVNSNTLNIICEGDVASKFDGNKNSTLQQCVNLFNLQVSGNLYLSQRVLSCGLSQSVYKAANIMLVSGSNSYIGYNIGAGAKTQQADFLNFNTNYLMSYTAGSAIPIMADTGYTSGTHPTLCCFTVNAAYACITPNFSNDTSSGNINAILNVPEILGSAATFGGLLSGTVTAWDSLTGGVTISGGNAFIQGLWICDGALTLSSGGLNAAALYTFTNGNTTGNDY